MMAFFGLYPAWKPNIIISKRIKMKCIDLEGLLNKLEPEMVFTEHLASLKQALFHSHTKVVQVTVKQLIRLASYQNLAEQLSRDMEVVLGLIENLAHKELRVAKDCVKLLLMLSCSQQAIKNLLCPDIADVLKTTMTYVAVRILVYEFIMQLSINSSIGLEKSYSCGILEDVINDFKNKESYMTTVHYHLLHTLAATPHGRSYLAKYDALDTVPKHQPDVTNETMTHLIRVIPDSSIPTEDPKNSQEKSKQKQFICKPISDNLSSVSTVTNHKKKVCDQLHKHSSESKVDKCVLSVRSSSPSSVSSPSDSSTISRRQDDHMVDHSCTPAADTLELQKLVTSMEDVIPHELFNMYPHALDLVLRSLACPDRQTVLSAMQVVGYVGSTVLGKRVLYKISKKERLMSIMMRKILHIMKHSSEDHVAQALNVLYSLINVCGGSVKYEKITRKWFRQMGRPQDILQMIVAMSQQSLETIQVAAHRVLQALCGQEWGLHYIKDRKGLLDILLSDPGDESEAVSEVKVATLQTLLMSPLASKMFKPHSLKQIHIFLHKFKGRL